MQPSNAQSTRNPKHVPTDAKAVLKALLPDGVPALEPDDEAAQALRQRRAA
jgi:hypothetical protein